MADPEFARRIRERYPEGLTGLFAIGATRRTYILERNRTQNNPGQIADFADQGAYLQGRYFSFIQTFFELGGQNMLIGALSYRSFFERGGEYADLVTQEVLRLLDDDASAFYQANNIDPYFNGIDTLLLLPPDSPGHQTAQRMVDFQKRWNYAEGRHKLLWDIASIPLLTFWQMFEGLTAAEREAIAAEAVLHAEDGGNGLEDLFWRLYRRFGRFAYGTELPAPQLYVGTNMSGDLKLRGPLVLALTSGEYHARVLRSLSAADDD